MTTTLQVDAFVADLSQWIDVEVPAEAVRIHRKVAFDGMRGVCRLTRVDTGRAKGNWQVSVGTPIESATEATDKSLGGDAGAGRALAAMGNLAPWQVVYITNNLPYIVPLEFGVKPRKRSKKELRAMFAAIREREARMEGRFSRWRNADENGADRAKTEAYIDRVRAAAKLPANGDGMVRRTLQEITEKIRGGRV